MAIRAKPERVYIKLGTSCNLHCKYCHSEAIDVKFNPAILPVLKSFDLKRITFGGGEPLLYWDTLKQIVNYLGDTVQYKVVTNGTLFTQEIVDFCNSYNFLFFISVDGLNTTRDMSKPIQWDLIKQLKFCGTAVTYYRENRNILNELASLDSLKEKYLTVEPWIFSSFPNFVHSTSKIGESASDLELVSDYLNQMEVLSREAFKLYKNGMVTGFLRRIFRSYVLKRNFTGVRCCNDEYFAILADGSITVCPYTKDIIGSVLDLQSVDWAKVQTDYSSGECKDCELFSVCGNYCCKNVTDHECLIMKEMHVVIVNLMNEFKISYDELVELFG